MWYYVKDGAQQGPVSEDEIRRMARDGVLHRDDLVWSEGMASWVPAGDALDLPAPSAAVGTVYSPPPQYAPPPSGPAPAAPMFGATAVIPDYLPWAIVVTLFCCAFTGIPSIIFSVRANSAKQYGDLDAAQAAANQAKTWLFVSLGLGLVVIAIYAVAIVGGALNK